MKDIIKFIKERRPRSFILENVLGIADSGPREASALDVVTSDLSASGYNVKVISVTSDAWGTCSRQRLDLHLASPGRTSKRV